MINKCICVTSKTFSNNEKLVAKLKDNFEHVILNNKHEFTSEELVLFAKDADGIILGKEKIDHLLLSQLPNLRIISNYGVGIDNVDIESCRKHNVKFLYQRGINKKSVSELTLCMMISLIRNVYSSSLALKNGKWIKKGGSNLTGKTVGIVGLGFVGKDLVELLQPFGCTILANDIQFDQIFANQYNVKQATKKELYKNSDIVTIHVPLTEKTKGLISLKEFSSMKDSCIFINTSRGDVVVEEDLLFALKNNVIAGAGIDVYHDEPPSNIELLSLQNLLCTPHIGGASQESILGLGTASIDMLLSFFNNNNQ